MSIELTRNGRLLRLTLNRPEKRNALDLATCRAIATALAEAGDDATVGAILIASNGPAFCAGMDLSEAGNVDPNALAEAHDRLFTFREWVKKPVVAAVSGAALAGGTGLVANAHIVIAADSASFGLTEVRIGLWPVLIFPAMVAALGERRAIELALTGRVFSAPDALRYGLATEVIAPHLLDARAAELASSLAGASASAVQSGLAYAREIRGKSTASALEYGRLVRTQMMQDPDFLEGARAFREKRPPAWPSVRLT